MAEADLISWDLDILSLSATELMQLAALVFRQSGVLAAFDIPSATLAAFLAAVGSRYHNNPYHNWNHGVHGKSSRRLESTPRAGQPSRCAFAPAEPSSLISTPMRAVATQHTHTLDSRVSQSFSARGYCSAT